MSSTPDRLTGRVALVTGGARGVGQAVALRLAADGAAVAVADVAPADDTVEAITRAGGRAAAFTGDISEPDDVTRLIGDVTAQLGPVDVLINNAGIYPAHPLPTITKQQWDRVFAVNVDGPLLLIQATTPGMAERGWGRIVNVVSNSMSLVLTDNAHYISSKLALVGLTRAAATQWGNHGVTVNAIGPSLTRTPGTEAAPPEAFTAIAQQQAIKRTQEPDDLADAIAFLASDDARFITAQTIYADGGLVRTA